MSNRRISLTRAEVCLLLGSLFAIVTYRTLAVPLRKPFNLYLERIGQGFMLYVCGLFLSIFIFRLSDIRSARKAALVKTWGETLARWRSTYARKSVLVSDARLLNVFALTFVVFIELKHLVPFLRLRVYDESFLHMERFLFGGKLAGEHLQSLIGAQAAPLLSLGYLFFYPYMAIVSVYVLLQREEGFRERFAFTFTLIWMLGALAIYLLPTLGPCFSYPIINAALPITEVANMQRDLWTHREFVLANPRSSEGVYLISGFPSIHLAIPLSCGYLFYRSHKALFYLSLVTAALTVLTTLYFGWHYACDDLGSFLLAALALGLSVRKAA